MSRVELRAASVVAAVALCLAASTALVVVSVALPSGYLAPQHLVIVSAGLMTVGTVIGAGIAWWTTESIVRSGSSTRHLATETSSRAVLIGVTLVATTFVMVGVPSVVDLDEFVTLGSLWDRVVGPVALQIGYGAFAWIIGAGLLGPLAFAVIFPIVAVWVWFVRRLAR